MKVIRTSFLMLFICISSYGFSQDSVVTRPAPAADTTTPVIKLDTPRIKRHNPKIATRRSLILPGWGQAYNREYWKIPIVWGALGTCVGVWIYNNTWYHRTRFAYSLVIDTMTARYGEIHPRLINPRNNQPLDALSLQTYRNTFRRDRDYAVLYFLAVWAVNVADATVFAHLKEFDVSDDLSLKVKPTINPFQQSAGLTLSLSVR